MKQIITLILLAISSSSYSQSKLINKSENEVQFVLNNSLDSISFYNLKKNLEETYKIKMLIADIKFSRKKLSSLNCELQTISGQKSSVSGKKIKKITIELNKDLESKYYIASVEVENVKNKR